MGDILDAYLVFSEMGAVISLIVHIYCNIQQ